MIRRAGAARILSLVDLLATAALLLLIFVVPTYATAGAGASGQTGAVTQTGSATLVASNPQAFAALMAIAALAAATLVLALMTAWLDWFLARWALAALLTALTALAILAVFSIGIFMAPLITLGWLVFAQSARPTQPQLHTHSPRG